MEQNELKNVYIFVISNSHNFISQTLKVAGPLGKKIIFSLLKKLSETLETMKTTFPSIFVLLQISATIPITTCQCERFISRLRLFKTYLRSALTQGRLNGLAMSSRCDKDFDLDDIVNRFPLKKERRMTLMNILETDDALISKHLSMYEDDCLDL